MIDFSKGHIKLYLYNDVDLFENLRKAFKDDLLISTFLNFSRLVRKSIDGHNKVPYYIRVWDGTYVGRNNNGEYHGYDTDDMIIVDGYDMLKMKNGVLPETLFQM